MQRHVNLKQQCDFFLAILGEDERKNGTDEARTPDGRERRKSVDVTRTKISAFVICHVNLHFKTLCPVRKSSV